MSRALLLSVRPRFASALLAGTKTAEVRRRFPDVPAGATVVIYSSSPDKAVLGTMRARALVRSSSEGIWRDYANSISIDRVELESYLDGAQESTILELDSPETWARPVPLETMRRVLRIEPAQSFRYLNGRQLAKLESLAGADRGSEDARPMLDDLRSCPVLA